MKISLIITTYNRPDALNLVLESLKKQTKKPFEIIIADDGSKNETKMVIERFVENSNIKTIHTWQEDKGFRASMIRNRAVANSNGDYIIFIDGDMILHRYFIQDYIKTAENGVFIQGSRVLLDRVLTEKALKEELTNFTLLQKGLQNRKNGIHSPLFSKIFSKYTTSTKGIRTCNFALFRDDFFRVNGFDNSFVGWGREDSEFAIRLLNSGVKRKNLKFLAIAYHLFHNESSRDSLPENDKKLNNTIKNRIDWTENGVDRFIKF